MANEYLKRQPTSTGNTKVFTISLWAKVSKDDAGTGTNFFSTGDNDSVAVKTTNLMSNFYINSNVLQMYEYRSSTANLNITSTAKYRDYGSWTHFLYVVDTTQNDSTNRFKFYVNGARVRDTTQTTIPSKNFDMDVNSSGALHAVGRYLGNHGGSPTYVCAAEMTDFFFIDGQALTPDVFGFYKVGKGYVSAGSTQSTDFRPGQWVPKTPRVIKTAINNNGGFGVNGFYLPMNDSNNFGADFHCDPNSIIKLQENLPQPRCRIDGVGDYTGALRDDPFKQYLVLALPFVSGGLQSGFGDYSAAIKGSGSPKSITVTGTVSIANTASYYGSAALFNATSAAENNLLTVNNAVCDFGTGDFTVEVWGYPFVIDTGNNNYIMETTGLGGTRFAIVRVGGENIGEYYLVIGNNVYTITGTNYGINQWHHLAVCRKNGVVTAYLNGVATYTNTITTDITAQSGVYIGSYQPNASAIYEYQGYLQDLRIYKGVAKYKGGFDVPRPYTPVGIATWRAVPDSPANNFATLNAVQNSMSLTDGNLTCTGTGSNQEVYSTIGITTGKWYVEARTNVGTHNHFGVRANSTATYATDYRLIARDDGNVYGDTSQGQVGTLSSGYASAGNIVAMAIDGNLGQITYYVNGVNVGGPYSIYQYNSSSLPTPYKIYNLANSGDSLTVNFGQNPSFSGNIGNFAFKIAKIYSTFNGSVRSANYTVQYSDDNVNWTTAWTGVATNNTSCGIQVNSGGGGNYGAHRYWRYVEGSPVDSHHPRVSRIILSDGITDVNIVTYTSDNCSDTGEYVIGTVTYDGKNGAGTFTDSNGKGLFKYQPPSGFLALCEDNLPTPAISNPGEYFKTVLYTGDGNSGRSITGIGFTPDLVWIKDRGSTAYNYLFDSVRGGDAYLWSNSTGAEGSIYQKLSFNANGFSLINGTDGSYPSEGNRNGNNIVAWCWRAGAGTTSTNTNGSITSQVSANQTAGFSIVSYTGTGASNATVGHGLGKVPAFGVVKCRDTNSVSNEWRTQHKGLTSGYYIALNSTAAQAQISATSYGSLGTFTSSSTVTLQAGATDSTTTNENGKRYIMYLWAEIEGFSKFGSYTGNGSADGPFIYTGGRPAFVMIKRTDSTQNWPIIDSSRDSVNVANRRLFANLSDIEDQGIPNFVDILSNGFKCRDSNVSYNASGGTYIFACWMESPFTTANSK